MPSERLRKEGRFTYSDYLGWSDDERWELIDGGAWAMSPSPTVVHQLVSARLTVLLFAFFENRDCRVLNAPLDVVLSEHDVVQPDILVVCDKSRITPSHVAGAPDFIVEILSPSTAAKDRREKFDLYERHGVREYLIVHLEEQMVESFALQADGRYGRPTIVASGETWRSAIFEGLEVDFTRVFAT